MFLEMKSISKNFSGVHALSDVDFSCYRGEVHALIGENGAGKSTLIKILGGVYRPDKGEIVLNGKKVIISSPSKAHELGIGIMYQEPCLIPYLTVMQNIFLAHEQVSKFGFINSKNMKNQIKREMSNFGIDINLNARVCDLPYERRQMVALCKVLYLPHTQIIVMDEVTAPLASKEVEILFNIIKLLKEQGKTIIYISHRLEEIFQIADRVTVLKDGKLVKCKEVKETDKNELVKMMVGRELGDWFPPRKYSHIGRKRLLEVRGLYAVGLEDINLTLYEGEILGIAGLQGQGQERLAKVIFGDEPKRKGRIYISGKEVGINNPIDALRAGIVFVSSDRRGEGLVLSLSVLKNSVLSSLNKRQKFGFIEVREEKRVVEKVISDLAIKCSHINQEVQYLSGGNQQKVILARNIIRGFKIAIFVAPTQGIDVGSKKEIYYLMQKLTEEGTGVVMVSYELPEILGLSDRIVVMYEGKIVQEFYRGEATEEKILSASIERSSRA